MSVNNRVRKKLLQACRFGFCICQIVNRAVATQSSYPNFCILATKIDYKSAYWRGHLNAETALQTCTQLLDKGMAVVTFQNTFGRAPCPYEWGIKSERICNLANELIVSKKWNPLTLHATSSATDTSKKISRQQFAFGSGPQAHYRRPRGSKKEN
jgi:hypothetical protein